MSEEQSKSNNFVSIFKKTLFLTTLWATSYYCVKLIGTVFEKVLEAAEYEEECECEECEEEHEEEKNPVNITFYINK